MTCSTKEVGDDLIRATHHHTYRVATYVRSSIENAQLCKTSDLNNTHGVDIMVGDINISNIYINLLPPSGHLIICPPHPTQLYMWLQQPYILNIGPKQRGSFKSADDITPLRATRRILSDFPQSQHRPAIKELGISIPLIHDQNGI